MYVVLEENGFMYANHLVPISFDVQTWNKLGL